MKIKYKCLFGNLAKHQNPILHAVPFVSQNLSVEFLNQFYIFLPRKYASFGHSVYCCNHYGRLLNLKVKYGKSLKNFLSIFTWRHHTFSPNVLSWFTYISIMKLQDDTFLLICVMHSWRVTLAKQETQTPSGHLVSPLVCRSPWMSTVVLYCWCHSDSASVILYFTLCWYIVVLAC